MMKKPDWFELADNDNAPVRSAKSTKSALAIVATLAITSLAGWGFLGSQEPQASASDISGTTSANQSAPATTSPTNSAVATPSASTSSSSVEILPPSGNIEEGREHHEFGDHEEREGHKGRNHHEISGTFKSSDDHGFGDDD